jgi:hypothetical protein
MLVLIIFDSSEALVSKADGSEFVAEEVESHYPTTITIWDLHSFAFEWSSEAF